MKDYKLVIPIVAKDISLVVNNIDRIRDYLNAYKLVFIGDSEIEKYLPDLEYIEFLDENTLFSNLTIDKVKEILTLKTGTSNRAGWYFQQFLKMAYAQRCEDEYYLVWDSDTLPLKEISFFDSSGRPYLSYKKFEKYDLAYFETIKNIFNIDLPPKAELKSHVVEHMLFNTKIMKHLISAIENNQNLLGDSFFEKIINSIPGKNLNLSGFSEFETYFSFVRKEYPDVYEYREWNNLRCGKIFLGKQPDAKSLEWIANQFISVSIERYDKEWRIFKISRIKKIKFKHLYNFFYPIITMNHSIRMVLRKYFKNIYLKISNLKK